MHPSLKPVTSIWRLEKDYMNVDSNGVWAKEEDPTSQRMVVVDIIIKVAALAYSLLEFH